jgi:hypothetical protein
MINVKSFNSAHSISMFGKNRTTYHAEEVKSMMLDPSKGLLIVDQQDRAYFIPNSNIVQVNLESADAFEGKKPVK